MFIILHNQPDPEDVHQHNCHIEDYLPAPQLHFLQPPVEKHLDHRKRNKILLPLILNYKFLDKPSVAMEIAGSNLNQMKGSMGKGKGESLWPLTSHLSHTFYTGVYIILFNLQYWLVSFLSVLYAGEYVLSSVYWVLQTLQLPWVTKTEFLLTISIQYHADKWWELRKISIWG